MRPLTFESADAGAAIERTTSRASPILMSSWSPAASQSPRTACSQRLTPIPPSSADRLVPPAPQRVTQPTNRTSVEATSDEPTARRASVQPVVRCQGEEPREHRLATGAGELDDDLAVTHRDDTAEAEQLMGDLVAGTEHRRLLEV